MIIKTAIALFLTASLAGGAVYYGTQDETVQNGEVSLGEHPHKSAETSEDIENDDIEAVEETQIEPSNVSTIDRLLNRTPKDEETSEAEIAEAEELTTEGVEIDAAIEDELDPMAGPDVSKDMQFAEPVIDDKMDNVVDIQSADDLYDFAMTQAERIETPDIRDQAYLDIVDYACKNKDYRRAQSTTPKITKTQMRDNAHSRIAISMAQRGMAALAFEEIDKVETEELRDVMRLQVLQALIQK